MVRSGVYRIAIERDGCRPMFYIGQATNITSRRNRHIQDLRRGKHKNRRLQRVFNKYGEKAFSFTIVLICEKAALTMYEQIVLDFYPADQTYNFCRECVTSRAGVPLSKSHRSRIAKAAIGKKASEETRGRISEGRKGWSPSAVHLAHLRRLANSPENRSRMAAWAKGPGRLAKIGKKKSPEEIARRTATRRANAALRQASY